MSQLPDEQGVGWVEWILIVILVLMVLVTIFYLFSPALANFWQEMLESLQ